MPEKFHLSKSVFDKALTKEASKNYRLSILVSQDGFSFCIFDATRNKYSALEAYDLQDAFTADLLATMLETIIPASEWLSHHYQQVKIIWDNDRKTLIPNPLFRPGEEKEYLRFNHPLAEEDIVRHDRLPNLDAVNIYSIPQRILSLLEKYFPGACVNHASSALIENLVISNKNRDESKMIFVNVKKNDFDIAVFDGRKLLFFNSFPYQTKEDFAYYLIYVIEQLGMNPEKVEMKLSGEILKISDIYDITYKYVREVSFTGRNEDYSYSYVFDEIPAHFYYNLLNLQRCEL